MIIPIPTGAIRRAAEKARREEQARREAAARAGISCPVCGNVDLPVQRRRGSRALHAFLYLCWIIPGFVYGLWRDRQRVLRCRKCNTLMGEVPDAG